MTRRDGRLDKLAYGLTAKERALHALHKTVEGRKPDPTIINTMPREQAREFTHNVFVLNSLILELSAYLAVLSQMLEQIHLRLFCLNILKMWGGAITSLGWYISSFTGEPVTQSEYDRLVQERRETMVPASWLAEKLVERYEGWADGDPLTPVTRAMLGMVQRSLEGARRGLQEYIGEFEMPGPDENDLTQLKTYLARTEATFSLRR